MKQIKIGIIAALFLPLLASCGSGGYEITMDDQVVGDSIVFTGLEHNSVGLVYEIEYDVDKFDVTKDFEYKNPKNKRMRGGDKGTATYTLRPKAKGKYTLYEVETFKGKEQKRIEHKVVVKRK